MEPRGIRNNNPGNIRHGDTIWTGQAVTQPDPAFVTFVAPEYGIRAIAKILLTYERDGLTTIGQVINRWAPPAENDTDAYVEAVCNECAAGANTQVNIHDMLLPLIKAIIQHENGKQPYPDALINQGIALATGVAT